MSLRPSEARAGLSAQERTRQIDDHRATAGKVRVGWRAVSGQQAGDPVRAVQAVVKAVSSGNPPHRLLLGNDAFDGAMAKLDELRKDFMAREAAARAADFPKPKATALA